MAYMSLAAAHCRGGYYFCLDTKGSKKSSQQKGFFAAQAISLQIRQNLGCYIFTLLSLRTLAFTLL